MEAAFKLARKGASMVVDEKLQAMIPRVSVLVPNYNHASMIGRCIDSVLAQDYPSFELVVSDNASTDHSDRVIRSYTDRRLVYERQHANLGMVPNFRRCIELSRGEFLLAPGADDYLKPGMITQCASILESDPEIAFCHTAVEIFDDEGSVVGTTGAFQRSYVRDGREVIRPFLMGKRVVNSAAMFRRSRFLELGGWSSDYLNCFDIDLWFRMLLKWKVGYIGRILVGFRSHAVSTDWTILMAEEYLRFLRSMFERLPDDLADLRTLEPELVRALCTQQRRALSALPRSPDRDRVMAIVSALAAEEEKGGPPELWNTLRAGARRTVLTWLSRLPDEMRYLLGERLG